MSYSNQQVEDLYKYLIESAKNILIGRTTGGTVGETVFVTLAVPHKGQMNLTGVTIQDCPPGECLALNDGTAWYVVSNNSACVQNETLIRLRKFRGIEEKTLKHKMAILYTSLTDEIDKCTCPKFSEVKGKCKENCEVGTYSSLEECQSRSNLWTVYMSAGVDHWHRVNYVSRHYPEVKATFDIYPDNRVDKPDFGSIIYDLPYTPTIYPPSESAGTFLYKLTGINPDFFVSTTFVGSLRWHGEEDLKAVNYSSYIYMWRKDSSDYKNTKDPYSLYKRLEDLYVLGPYAYRYYNNIDSEYPRGYYLPRLTSFAEGGYATPYIGMMMNVEPKNVNRGLDFFNTILSSRLGGNNLRIDYVLDKYRKLIKNYNSPPPPPEYEPPEKGKLYFLLGGDKEKPVKLPFSLSQDDRYETFLSVVSGKKIITVKHGFESHKGQWCKITTMVVDTKNKVQKNTVTHPGPVPPIEKEWRNHQIYKFNLEASPPTQELKCSHFYWSSSISNVANKLKVYPWNGEKAKIYEFNFNRDLPTFPTDILLKKQSIPYTTLSPSWQPAQNFCGVKNEKSQDNIKVFRLLTHDNQETTQGDNRLKLLNYAIYESR